MVRNHFTCLVPHSHVRLKTYRKKTYFHGPLYVNVFHWLVVTTDLWGYVWLSLFCTHDKMYSGVFQNLYPLSKKQIYECWPVIRFVSWDQALFSFRFENYIPAGKTKPLERMYENRSNWAWPQVIRFVSIVMPQDYYFKNAIKKPPYFVE